LEWRQDGLESPVFSPDGRDSAKPYVATYEQKMPPARWCSQRGTQSSGVPFFLPIPTPFTT